MSWILFISYLIIALFFTFNKKIKLIISKHFAIFFYYLTTLSFVNIISTTLVLKFAVLFTVLYIGWVIVNIVKVHQKTFDLTDDENSKFYAETMLQFSFSLILLTIVIILMIK